MRRPEGCDDISVDLLQTLPDGVEDPHILLSAFSRFTHPDDFLRSSAHRQLSRTLLITKARAAWFLAPTLLKPIIVAVTRSLKK
jgi:hypothetical protein